MTVMGQQARDIYKNQAAIRQQVADAAGGGDTTGILQDWSTDVYGYSTGALRGSLVQGQPGCRALGW